jgi:dTDP-4-dehydrorhamnose reductase
MRITIFGATGLLGKALVLERGTDEIAGLGSKDVDIRNAEDVLAAARQTRAEWTILAAAYTDVDGCERNPAQAWEVNYQGAVNVAKAAKASNSRLLFLSTDYVFDGTKSTPYETSDLRAPQSVYGSSKAKAEAALAEVLPECCIVRTSWLFGMGGRCFPDTILKLGAERKEIDVVNDQRGSPTYAIDLARAIYQLCHRQAAGIVHATNSGECTWFDFAREILKGAGVTTVVRPASSATIVRPAERPKYSVLSPKSLEPYAITLRPWQEALQGYLKARTCGMPGALESRAEV